VDSALMDRIIERLKMRKVSFSEFMFVGDCPVCGGGPNFILWKDKGRVKCFKCGLDGVFGPVIERIME
jgi:ribosomal protein S27AE